MSRISFSFLSLLNVKKITLYTKCPRGIYFVKYYGRGGGNGQPGKKMKLGVREKK